MFSTGAWATAPGGLTITGLDNVDMWVGGLAEITNLFGGLLGTTFNYVFQLSLENLQESDRFYYLARTPGMNLRTQLEGNSFAELIQRNTDGTNTLKADAFASADCKFQLGRLTFPAPAGSFNTGPGSIADDPLTTDCDENLLLLRNPTTATAGNPIGTVQYRQFNSVDPSGINGQAVYNGTPGVDRVFGGNDNDTFWGGPGKDVIEGNGGDDIALGGDDNDIITDLGGADVLKGGPGNDAIDTGIGDDISMGGEGQDFMNGGANDNEAFAGPGNDFMIAGQGADAVFGDGGDDWIQGGSGQDLLQGDHAAPFFDDPAEVRPGNDIFIGQVGENDYDAEGGDDLMAQNAAVDRNAGSAGFDWAFHQYDSVGADDDMMINQQLRGVPIQVVVNRDRWQEVEADSGSNFNDVLRGDDIAAAVAVGGFSGCDALDPIGVARIAGLNRLVTSFPSTLSSVIGASVMKQCPSVGYDGTPLGLESGSVWAEGNILLGGGGNDLIEGRGNDDIVDGDHALRVAITVRTNPADRTSEIGRTDLMEHKATSGNFGPGTTGMTLQQAVFAGLVDPGNLVAVREIVEPHRFADGPHGVHRCGRRLPRTHIRRSPQAWPGGRSSSCRARRTATRRHSSPRRDGRHRYRGARSGTVRHRRQRRWQHHRQRRGCRRPVTEQNTLWNVENLRFCLATTRTTSATPSTTSRSTRAPPHAAPAIDLSAYSLTFAPADIGPPGQADHGDQRRNGPPGRLGGDDERPSCSSRPPAAARRWHHRRPAPPSSRSHRHRP